MLLSFTRQEIDIRDMKDPNQINFIYSKTN